jgi:hypothetical protein
MMFLQPLSMNFVFQAMLDEFINTNAPVIVQIGDFGYVVTGCGGDPDLENFVLSVADEPVCEWVDGECVKLNGDD